MKMNLLNRMLVFVLLPMIITVSALAYLSYSTSRDILKEEKEKELAMSASTFGTILDVRTNAIIRIMNFFAEMRSIRDALTDNHRGNAEGSRRIAAIISDMPKNFMTIEEGGLVDRNGTAIAHTRQNSVGAALSNREYINEALAGGHGSLTIRNKLSDFIATCIAIPVNGQNETLGAVYMVINWRKMEELVLNNLEIDPGSTVFALDRNGIVLMHSEKTEIGKDYSQSPAFRSILSATASGRADYEINDLSYTAYYEKIPFTGWSAVIQAQNNPPAGQLAFLARFNLALAAIFTVVAAAFAIFTARAITASIKRLSSIAVKISSGNLELTEQEQKLMDADCKRDDEIGHLCRGARGMLLDLKALISAKDNAAACAVLSAEEAKQKQLHSETAKHEELVVAAEQIAAVAGIIASTSAQLSVHIEQAEKDALHQARQADETAGAMQKINGAVLRVAKSAGQALNMSAEAREKAERCIADNHLTGKELNEILANSQSLKNILTALESRAVGNDRLMQSICDIADQTQHLALNACIEAAHLKSEGRRFSSTADEISKMAHKVMDSSTSALEAMQTLKEDLATGLKHSEAVAALSEQAGEHARSADTALRDIAELLEKTSKSVLDIAQACKNQADVSKNISNAAGQVETTAKETNMNMQEAAIAVSSLAEQSYILDSLIEGMRKQ